MVTCSWHDTQYVCYNDDDVLIEETGIDKSMTDLLEPKTDAISNHLPMKLPQNHHWCEEKHMLTATMVQQVLVLRLLLCCSPVHVTAKRAD